jgi:hypothetical protein
MSHRYLRHIALATYALSVCLPAFDDWAGWAVLGFGWAALLFLFPAWLANPLLIAAYFVIPDNPRLGLKLSGAAVLFGASTFFFPGVPGDDAWNKVSHWQPGSFIWGTSLVLMLVAAQIARHGGQPASSSPEVP